LGPLSQLPTLALLESLIVGGVGRVGGADLLIVEAWGLVLLFQEQEQQTGRQGLREGGKFGVQ